LLFNVLTNKIKLSEYKIYKNNFNNNWSLKNELIKYCEIDCICLYQIIFKFATLIFDILGRNIHHYPTLPSLAFAIFRSKFMENENIPQLSGKISDDIRQSYTGGSVDMYIPKAKKGVKIKCYDVNSLYPTVMKNCLMPIGVPTFFQGDIRAIDKDAFGFFFCKIIAPDKIKHPIIQTHVKTNGGIRTIAPIGQWSDMLFSMEMDNAMKLGYKFERKNIFKDYVDTLYSLRLNYPKSKPLNLIAKLLLNSLYGRFGMVDTFPNIDIIDNSDFVKFEEKFLDDIMDFVPLDNKVMVVYRSNQKDINTLLDGHKETHNVSIAIASAITAYSRIHMSQFKNHSEYNLYYSDTDSIYIDSPLPKELVNSKILGKMKLEHIINKAIFLAPKVYYLETEDGKVIYKVKGLSHEIELTKNDFESLLCKDAFLEKLQTKWKKHIEEGNISVIDQLYTLQVTDNKREYLLFSVR